MPSKADIKRKADELSRIPLTTAAEQMLSLEAENTRLQAKVESQDETIRALVGQISPIS